jgi:type IV pilus assembly protein PilA
MKTRKQNKAGFTLVELMVVAIIVAILAAVAIPMMSGNKKRAMGTEAEAGIGTLLSSARVYLAEHDSYPATKDDINMISSTDLDGQFFDYVDYSFTGSSSNTYTIACTGTESSGRGDDEGKSAGMSVTLDEVGNWTRNY